MIKPLLLSLLTSFSALLYGCASTPKTAALAPLPIEPGIVTQDGIKISGALHRKFHEEYYSPDHLRLFAIDYDQQISTGAFKKTRVPISIKSDDTGTQIRIADGYVPPLSACFELSHFWESVPVREGKDRNAFSFSLDGYAQKLKIQKARARIATLDAQFQETDARVRQSKSALHGNAAYKNGSCVRPPQTPLPNKPQILSGEALTRETQNACYDLLHRRFPKNRLEDAMYAIGRDEVPANWLRWISNPKSKNSCAKQALPQSTTMPVNIVCGIFGDQISNVCIQQLFDQCQVKARSKCLAPLKNYERQVQRIQEKPTQYLSQCTKHKNTLADLKRIRERIVLTRKAATSFLAELQTQYVSTRSSLQDAVCSPQNQ